MRSNIQNNRHVIVYYKGFGLQLMLLCAKKYGPQITRTLHTENLPAIIEYVQYLLTSFDISTLHCWAF